MESNYSNLPFFHTLATIKLVNFDKMPSSPNALFVTFSPEVVIFNNVTGICIGTSKMNNFQLFLPFNIHILPLQILEIPSSFSSLTLSVILSSLPRFSGYMPVLSWYPKVRPHKQQFDRITSYNKVA